MKSVSLIFALFIICFFSFAATISYSDFNKNYGIEGDLYETAEQFLNRPEFNPNEKQALKKLLSISKISNDKRDKDNVVVYFMELTKKYAIGRTVKVKTTNSGAYVKCLAFADEKNESASETCGGLTNECSYDNLELGVYFFWTEREGVRTSNKEEHDITRKSNIHIVEYNQ